MQVYILGTDREARRVASELAEVGFEPILQATRAEDPGFTKRELPRVAASDVVLQLPGVNQHAVLTEANKHGIPIMQSARDLVRRYHPLAASGGFTVGCHGGHIIG